ncbi:THAP domain-containing protein 1-like isoform X2 [Stegodyphus dumicola]|uniref:THAP domain-containing protein 1-like isoform X2 n=1 Tax=Stegodyphus dumicola TaxID=202533 RepID=UPI0015AC95E8|nr:THAP domain-containing protein 1-like isoform X2 [Stegodyphus dumicola]
MARKCSVPECRSNYDGTNKHVSTFKFPSDPLLSEKWVKNINRKDFVIRKYSNVCIKHFEEEFIVREDKAVRDDGTLLVVPRTIPTLKKNAYPTIFQNQSSYLSKKLSTKRKTYEERESEINAGDKQFEQREKNDVITNFRKTKASASHSQQK